MLGNNRPKRKVAKKSVFVEDEPISEASEGGDDGNDCENNETITDEQGKVEDPERDASASPVGVKRKNRLCAYCFELVIETDMILVPKSAAIRKEWIEVFGDQFELFIQCRKTPYLCKKHLDDETRQPKAEAIYKDRKFEMKKYFFKLGNKVKGKESVLVEDEPIPGASALEREDDGNDGNDWEHDEQEQENGEDPERDTAGGKTQYRYCAYCYEKTDRGDMVRVPKPPKRRKQWIKVLGKQFESFIKNNKSACLCKKHFDDGEVLPRAEAIYENRVYKRERRKKSPTIRLIRTTCCYCGAKTTRNVMRSVPTNLDKRELWIQRLGEKFREDAKSTHAAICNSHFPESLISTDGKVSGYALPIPLDESLNPTENNAFPLTTTMGCKCVYCGEHDLMMKMVPVPEGVLRDIWCEILGERFAMNLTKLEHLYICSSHFEEEMPTKDSIPCVDESLEFKETDNLQETALRFTCTYCCGWLKNEHTAFIPITPFRLETWSDVLGKEFEFRVFETETIRMCKIHLRREDFVTHRRQKIKDDAIPIPIAVSQQKKRSNISIIKQCLHCKRFDKLRNMRRIVYDEGKWPIYSEVFGPDFIESFLKEEHKLPAVCRIHLTEKGLPLRFINLQELERMAAEAQVDSSLSQVKEVKEEPMDEHKFYESNTPGCSTEPETMFYYATDELLDHSNADFS